MVVGAEKIIKNTTYLTVALVVQKVIAFFFFLFIARQLGGEGTGEYVAAFAFSALFAVFVDLGLSQVLVREIARAPEKSETYLRNSVALKMVLGVVVFGALLLTVKILDYFGAPHPSLGLVGLAGVIMLADSFVLTGTSLFRGWQNLWYESIVIIVHKLGVIVVGSIVLYYAPSPVNVAVAILFGGIASYVLLTYYLSKKISTPWWPTWNGAVIKKLLKLAAPFALAGFFATAYAQFDSILLSTMRGNEAVGLYSVAAKTMNAFVFIPSAFMAALYPAMSSYFIKAPDRLAEILERSLRYLLVISAPIAAGLFLLADKFVVRLGSDYIASAEAVKILMPSLVFMFLSYPLGALLNATNRQYWQTSILGGGLLINIILNIWLIPEFSYLGSSLAWFATNTLIFFTGLILARLVIIYRLNLLLLSAFRVGLASLFMILFVLRVENYLVISILGGAFVYIVGLIIVREISKDDINFFWRLFQSRSRPEVTNIID